MVEQLHADLVVRSDSRDGHEGDGGDIVTPKAGEADRRRSSLSMEEQTALKLTDPDKPQGWAGVPPGRTLALDWRTLFLSKVLVPRRRLFPSPALTPL